MTSGATPEDPTAAPAAAAWWAVRASTDGVAVFDSEWRIRFVNAVGAAVLDREPAQLLGRSIWEVFPEAVGTAFHSSLLAAAAAPPGAEPVRWSAYYGPVHGWFTDAAQRIGDHVVVVYTRADEPHAAELTRQRLTAQVQADLARSEMLLAASSEFGAAATVEEVADALQRLTGTGLSPASVGLYLRDPDRRDQLLRLRAEEVADPLRARYERVDLHAELPVTRAVRSATPLYFGRAEDVIDPFPELADDVRMLGMQAAAAIPVPDPAGSGTPLGALALVWTTPRELDVSDRAALLSLATHVGQAVARIGRTVREVRAVEGRYADTRAAVLTMQRSLLSDLPVLPYADVAAHYQPADAELAAGGDWYDSTPLPDGRVALMVGDVVGHGPAAAAAMAQLRAIGNHLLRTGTDPAEVLAQLDAAAARGAGTRATSVLLAVLDPAGRLSWASQGHPGPLRVPPAGPPVPLPTGPAVPLGVGGPPAGWHSTRLDPGDVVLLFTDGLVERPGRSLPDGMDALLAEVRRSRPAGGWPDAPALQELATGLVDRLPHSGDDITVLAARLHDPTPALRARIDGDPAGLRVARRALAGWLAPFGIDPEDAMLLELVVGEAAANALEHAYGAGRGPVELEARLDPGGVCVLTVRDRGRWRPAPADPAQRGRGLQLIRALSDQLEVRRGEQGTVLVARRQLHRAAAIGVDARPAAPARRPDEDYGSTLTRGLPAVLRLHGVVDMTAERRLRTDVLGAARGGAVPVVVDLDGVTLLGSAGIRVLHELSGPLDLRLRAAAGTPARAVLELPGLAGQLRPAESLAEA